MNCLIISEHGQICDNLCRMINNIYPNDNNWIDRTDSIFNAKNMLRDKDIIIVDEYVNGSSGLEFLTKVRNDIESPNKKVIYLCMPERAKEMNDALEKQQFKNGGEYEYWFKIFIKGEKEDKLRELLK